MGSATSYETSGGRRYRVRYRKPDRSQTDKRGFRTKPEAELFLASVEVAKSSGRYIDPTRARVTIGDWLNQWVATRTDLRRSSFDRLEGAVRLHIVPALGPIALGDLTRFDGQTWGSKLSATQSPGSVLKIVNVLSAGLQVAVDDGRIPANPASRRKMPRQSKTRKKFLTHQQVAELAAAVDAKPAGEGYGLFVLVLAYTGLRWGELAGPRVRDLEFVRVRLDVHTTMVEVDGYMEESSPKDYEERSIPVPEFILEQLSVHVENKTRADQMPVGSKSRAGLRNRTFRRGWFNDAAEQIGIPGLTPHELRRVGAIGTALRRRLGNRAAGDHVGLPYGAREPLSSSFRSCGLTKKNEIVHSFS